MDIGKLLAIVMRAGLPGQNVVALAEELILRAGGLEALSHMKYLDIMGLKVPGIGEVKSMELEAAFEIGRRTSANALSATPRKISDSSDVFDVMSPYFDGAKQEYFYTIPLDTKGRMMGQPIHIAKGTRDRCSASVGEILIPAMMRGSAIVVLVHNHPSGEPTPSRDDIAMTVRLVSAAKIMGVKLIDHIVIGKKTDSCPSGHVSMASEGLVVF